MLHKSSAAASASASCSPHLSSPTPLPLLGPLPFGSSLVLSPAQSQPVPISNPLAIRPSLLPFCISFALFCHFSLSCLFPFPTRGRQKVLDSIYKICLLPLLFLFLFLLLFLFLFTLHSFSFFSPAFYDYFCIIWQAKIINF